MFQPRQSHQTQVAVDRFRNVDRTRTEHYPGLGQTDPARVAKDVLVYTQPETTDVGYTGHLL
jgi:hypothetical protein